MMRRTSVTPSAAQRRGRDVGAAGLVSTPSVVGACHPRSWACGVRAAGMDPRGAGGDSQNAGRSERKKRATAYEVKVRDVEVSCPHRGTMRHAAVLSWTGSSCPCGRCATGACAEPPSSRRRSTSIVPQA